MIVKCRCGHDTHVEMPFDDNRTVYIACGRSCQAHRLEALVKRMEHVSKQPLETPGILAQLSSTMFVNQPASAHRTGMLGQ